MELEVQKVKLEAILSLRQLYLQENNYQIRYNACHERKTHRLLLVLVYDLMPIKAP